MSPSFSLDESALTNVFAMVPPLCIQVTAFLSLTSSKSTVSDVTWRRYYHILDHPTLPLPEEDPFLQIYHSLIQEGALCTWRSAEYSIDSIIAGTTFGPPTALYAKTLPRSRAVSSASSSLDVSPVDSPRPVPSNVAGDATYIPRAEVGPIVIDRMAVEEPEDQFASDKQTSDPVGYHCREIWIFHLDGRESQRAGIVGLRELESGEFGAETAYPTQIEGPAIAALEYTLFVQAVYNVLESGFRKIGGARIGDLFSFAGDPNDSDPTIRPLYSVRITIQITPTNLILHPWLTAVQHHKFVPIDSPPLPNSTNNIRRLSLDATVSRRASGIRELERSKWMVIPIPVPPPQPASTQIDIFAAREAVYHFASDGVEGGGGSNSTQVVLNNLKMRADAALSVCGEIERMIEDAVAKKKEEEERRVDSERREVVKEEVKVVGVVPADRRYDFC
ncbi:hypothetical protein HK097_003736 [Rhizophlyctis rosea]|uniref:Uncharacterized protein n=1 Tax=Rhizophlyctis rosea TaxID=64517 RepID=A0AAD5S4J8_9FUNG|nr:hypothetical protein HK097_003736 [Rhizophlyctis rosea]